MGKKRQKVQWFPVDNLDWANGEEQSAESSQSGAGARVQAKEKGMREGDTRHSAHAQQRRTSGSGGGWSSAVPPRFERRVTEPGEQELQGETKTIFYDGELCEAETLPNGFTKIRSKNLDILFKREYYEQRIATQKQLSEELSRTAGNNKNLDKEPTPGATTIPGYNDNENVSEKDIMVISHTESDSATLDKIDPDEIREFKPMNHGLETPLPEMESGQTSPFHLGTGYGNGSSVSSSGYPPADPELTGSEAAGYMTSGGRAANLYLYSPSNNTLIPCEEIIIPNPVMSPDTGEPMYTGPTNIYLAYPVQGPDGRSYITQPFPMAEQGYSGPGYPGYSQSVSYDSSTYYSSTPHTPNSGEDSGSGSSTQPTSPPPLVNFHPSNWFKPEAMLEAGPPVPETEQLHELTPLPSFHHFTPASASPKLSHQTEAAAEKAEKTNASVGSKSAAAEKVINASDNSSRLNSGSGSAAAAAASPSTITYIPGLPQEQMVQSSKPQKKRKKKSKPKVEKCNSEDSSIIFEFDTNSPPAKDAETSLEPEQRPELDSPVSSTEQVYEIQLTDDLADSLVNPPTDPEISEEEESPACDPILHSIQSINTETEIEDNSSSEPTIEAVTTPSTELLEDKEVRDITQIIHPESPSLQDTDNSTSEAKITKPTSNISEKKEDVANTASVAKPSDSQSKNEGAKTEKKSKNKKPKKGSSKSVLSSDEKKIAKEPIADQRSDSTSLLAPQGSSNDNKKSWSSVIKSSLPQPTSAEPTEPVASPKPEKKSTGSKKENSAEQRAKRRTAAEEKKHKSSIERSDSWENIPVSVTQQEDSWEKTAKKGKKKNNKKNKTEDSRKEKVTFEKEASVEAAAQPLPPVPAKTEPEEKVSQDLSPEAELTSAEAALAEAKEDTEADTEKRRLKKRRKKADSGEPEEAANAHRVLICDEQLQLQYTRELRAFAAARELGARDAMCSRLVEKVSVAGHCDVVYISELGCGINRGAMSFGRLYQGKYVPPEREDIETVTEEAAAENSDEVNEDDTDRNVRQEATIEEIDDDANEKESADINPAKDADIDLD